MVYTKSRKILEIEIAVLIILLGSLFFFTRRSKACTVAEPVQCCAGCAITCLCGGGTSYNCGFYRSDPNGWVCAIRHNVAVWPYCTDTWSATNDPECSNVDIWLKQGACPDTNLYNGEECQVADGSQEPFPCLGVVRCWAQPGKWDASQKQCVTCNGRVQGRKLASTSERCINLNNNGWPGCGAFWEDLACATIPATCESACGASPQCDEAANAPGVVVVGGVCNNCVFNADVWPHITINVPASVTENQEFSVSLTYTHDAAELGGIHLRWLFDKFDITDKAGCDAEYIPDNSVFAPGWEGIECSGLANGTTKTFKLKALAPGTQTLYYRAWDHTQDHDCGGGNFDYDRDPTSGSCSVNCEPSGFPGLWEDCDAYTNDITVLAAVVLPENTYPNGCTNLIDDDGDGCIDGADSDCGGKETDCIDDRDNDCDSLIDTDDPDCPASLINFKNPLEAGSIPEVIAALGDFIFFIGLALVILMIIIAGIIFMTAGGDPYKLSKAKRLLFWTAIGAAITIFSKGVSAIIKYIIGG